MNRSELRAGFLLFVLSVLATASVHADVWKTYTAKRNVRGIARDAGGTIWAATGGGLFSFNPADSSFASYTTSEGLRSTDLTVVGIDRSGGVWSGASNGFLHQLQPARIAWQYVTDISGLSSEPQREINRLVFSGDTMFICSDIGLSVFSVSRMEFIATYRRFGSGSSPLVGAVTGVAIAGGRLWVSTRSGCASSPVGASNPASPDSWQVYGVADGLPSAAVANLVASRDTVFAATASGLCRFNGTGWETLDGTQGLGIVDCSPSSDGGFTFITSGSFWKYIRGDRQQPSYTDPSNVLTAVSGDSILGTAASGILVYTRGSFVPEIPPGPSSNSFVSIAVDGRGTVWAGTGSANGNGIMRYDGYRWRSYTAALYPELGTDVYYKVSIGRGNSAWASNWGSGVALLDADGNIRRVLNKKTGLPPSLPSDTNFVSVGGVATDADGVTWLTVRTPPLNIAVMRFRPDSSLDSSVHYFRSMREPLNVFTDVVIDFNGTKWFANFSRFEPVQGSKLNYFNEHYSLPGTINGWGTMTTADGLTSNIVWSLAVDHDGSLWVGTDHGINIIFDPGDPANHIATYHPLREQGDQVIQAIVVDPLNNKWIATKQGVFVFSPDGTSMLNHYTVDNTDGKLLSDDVASLAIDGNTGTVWFGTENGLSSLKTLAVTPRSTFTDLRFSPNPFYIPAGGQLSVPDSVDGLVEGSSIKILTSSGMLVRELQARSESSPGGRLAIWDGRNNRGELVASGVYIVVAASEDGSMVAKGKIAVIRR